MAAALTRITKPVAEVHRVHRTCPWVPLWPPAWVLKQPHVFLPHAFVPAAASA